MTQTPQIHIDRQTLDGSPEEDVVDWTALGRRMWDFLTGRQAEISYHLDDVVVEVPRDTGPTSPRATWRFAGTISVTTSDDTTRRGADPS
ncbi:hypothetical protein [Nocardioides sp.]|uniref:hypothetical protein n=1 Tax=Nocardioides sp. TaxID=35761 RepID=UPI003515028C